MNGHLYDTTGRWEDSLVGKGLFHKHEDLGADPQHPSKHQVGWNMSVTSAQGLAETGRALGFIGSQPSCDNDLPVQWGTPHWKQRWSLLEKNSWCQPCSPQMSVPAHLHTHMPCMQIKIQMRHWRSCYLKSLQSLAILGNWNCQWSQQTVSSSRPFLNHGETDKKERLRQIPEHLAFSIRDFNTIQENYLPWRRIEGAKRMDRKGHLGGQVFSMAPLPVITP